MLVKIASNRSTKYSCLGLKFTKNYS
jgi:hypothetical protein